MKTNHFRKKLVLNKNTIADLNNKGMKDVVGGMPPPTWWTECISICKCLSDSGGQPCTAC